MSENKHLEEVVHFGHEQVFSGASTYTCLMFLSKQALDRARVGRVTDLKEWRKDGIAVRGTIPAESITDAEWVFAVGPGAALLEKLNAMPIKLEDVTNRIFQGIKTSADKIFIVEELTRSTDNVKVYSPEKDAEYSLEPKLLHPLIKGGDSKRYHLTKTKRLILFPYATNDGEGMQLIPENFFKARYPLTWNYLSENKRYLENRENGKMRGPRWYSYGRTQALDVMPLPKIFTPDIAAQSSFSLDESGELFFTGGVSGGYGILPKAEYSSKYLLGLLNSKLLEWFIHQTATQMRGGWYSYESRFIRGMPIRTVDLSAREGETHHDRMVQLVDQILEAKKQLAVAQTERDKTFYENKCATLDRQIDQLVYDLYDLTSDEIALVDAAGQ